MKKFVSTAEWRDNTDGHLYAEGDSFPFDGREISRERLNELESGHNRAGLVLIRAIEAQDEPVEVRKEEAPKKAAVSRKTASPKTAKSKSKNHEMTAGGRSRAAGSNGLYP